MRPFFIRDIGGITIEGEKPLEGSTICIHGGPGGNCLTMYPFFPSDSIAGRWYFVDLPNHGRSADTNGDWSKEKCIEVLQHFACSLEPPIRVLGLSFGANVALEWATRYPDDIESFVGISGCGDVSEVVQHQNKVLEQMPATVKELMARSEKASGVEASFLNNALWVETLDVWLRGNPGAQRYKEGTMEFYSNPEASAQYVQTWLLPYIHRNYVQQQLLQLQDVGISGLLIWGKDDRMGTEKSAMGYQVDDDNIICLELEDAGHCVFVDQPDIFFQTVDRFFQKSHLKK